MAGFLHKDQVVAAGPKQSDGQRTWMKISVPDGWASMKYLAPYSPGEPDEPLWLSIARGEMGIKEYAGEADNPRIVEYHRSTNLASNLSSEDETAWCSSFVNWCMEQANYEGTNSAWAKSWLNWGKPLTEPRLGCITVFSRGARFGHVGFYIGQTPTHIKVLGGNQSDAVNIAEFEKTRLLGYRWPAE